MALGGPSSSRVRSNASNASRLASRSNRPKASAAPFTPVMPKSWSWPSRLRQPATQPVSGLTSAAG